MGSGTARNRFVHAFRALAPGARVSGQDGEKREEDSLLECLISASPVGIVFLTQEGRLTRVNDVFCSMLGHAREDLERMDWHEILHPEDREILALQMHALLEDGTESFRMDKRCLDRGGNTVWTSIRVNLMKEGESAPWFVCQIEDISARKRAEQAYLDAANRYRTILECTADGFWVVEQETGRLLDVNERYSLMSGYSREALLSMRVSDIEANEDPEGVAAHIAKVLKDGSDLFETRHRTKGGELIDVEVSATSQQGTSLIVCFLRDITARKTSEKQLRLLAMVFENSGEGIIITDAENRIEKVNLSFTRLTGYRFEEVAGRNPRMLSSGLQSREFYQAMWKRLLEEGYWQGEIWDRRKNGETYPKWLSIAVVRNEQGEVVNFIGSFSDIAELKRAEREIEKLAYQDPLTGLPNRFSLLAQFEQAIARARRNHARVALMFIDLDRFKIINDTLGHHIGDKLIVKVGDRLKKTVGEREIVARFGGDEFVVLLQEAETILAVEAIATSIVKDLAQPHFVEGINLFSSPSVGISIFPDDGDNIHTIMKNADTAMYQAKSSGGGRCRLFDAAMTAKSAERLRFENGLRTALENREFELHYQPQIAADGKVKALEALIRWYHPEFGSVSPARFIPIAEETGLILEIGKWVLKTACADLARWVERGMEDLRVAVNVSSLEFLQDGFVGSIGGIIREAGVRTNQVELEITESMAMANPERVIGIMRSLKADSIRLSIDDFGTGYSSLSYLKLFPIDQIKIDRSFIKDMDVDMNDKAITISTIALAQKLGLEVVAEGVESYQQSEVLFAQGCDLIQGYVFSKPMAAADITRLFERMETA